MQPNFIHEHFSLGQDRQVVAGMSFGPENTGHPVNGFRLGRASVDQAVTWIRS